MNLPRRAARLEDRDAIDYEKYVLKRHVACPPFDWEEDEDNLDQFKADHSELMKRPDPFGQKIVVEERTVLKTSFSSLDKTAQFYKAEHSGAILLKPEGIRGGIGKFAAHPEASQGPRRQNENHESAFSRQQQIPQNPGSAFSRRFEPQNAFQPLRDATHNGQSQNEFSQISNRQQQGSSKMPQRRIGASKLNQMKPGSSRASFHRIPHPQEGFFRPDDHEKERALLDEPYPKLPARGEKVVKRPRVPGVKSMFHRENEHNRQNPLRPRHTHNGRNQMKLVCTEFQPDDIISTLIKPGPHFDDNYGYELDHLRTRGISNLRVANKFEDCGFLDATMDLIRTRGLEKMTAIQSATIPYLMARQNYNSSDRTLLLRSPAGSGKTLAVMLCIINRILHIRQKFGTEKVGSTAPTAIVLTHNNLACCQVAKEIMALCPKESSIKVGISCGSQDVKTTNKMIEAGVDILVVTSGRLDNHIFKHAENSLHLVSLDSLRYFVIDEADTFFNNVNFNGYGNYYRYVDASLRHLHDQCVRFKLILLTHNFNEFNDLKGVIPTPVVNNKKCMHLLATITVGAQTVPITTKAKVVDTTAYDKFDCLVAHLKNKSLCNGRSVPKTIVYVNENDECGLVAHRLCSAGFRARSIASQDYTNVFVKTFSDFTKGAFDIIVTQDLGARAVNIPGLRMIVQYDVPKDFNSMNNLLSAWGRVGRMGHEGFAFFFLDFEVNCIEAPGYIKTVKSQYADIDVSEEIILKCKPYVSNGYFSD